MSNNNFKKDKTKKQKTDSVVIETAKKLMIKYKDVLEGLKDK